ncbi:hypothetical protein Bca52824_065443 [Brassica carinata]|uniref:Uncharacterized protein n=1 Tax=Brassica carinata TaxID=52824 RepID=A0A8X7QNF1_BRACI|nr:hypothetical protein Bca52824_065443 [Brassica carinata]
MRMLSHHPCKQWSFNTDAESASTIAKRIQTIVVEKTKHTCLRLELSGADPIYGKGTWHHSRFVISGQKSHMEQMAKK